MYVINGSVQTECSEADIKFVITLGVHVYKILEGQFYINVTIKQQRIHENKFILSTTSASKNCRKSGSSRRIGCFETLLRYLKSKRQ